MTWTWWQILEFKRQDGSDDADMLHVFETQKNDIWAHAKPKKLNSIVENLKKTSPQEYMRRHKTSLTSCLIPGQTIAEQKW